MLLCIGNLTAQKVKAQDATSYDPEKVYQEPTDPKVKQKIAEWQDLKFGLFMHWGTYSIWGIVESWSLCPEDRGFTQRKGPSSATWAGYKQAYENLQTQFNPVKFDPGKWAAAAKAGGMRYVVFTTKHHDGFCMYDTKFTDYKVTSSKTPFSSNPKSNVTKEIFNAFRKQDFMIGAYYSKPDWHSEDYWWSYFPPKDRTESYDRGKYPERWKRFTDYTYNQLNEITSEYGKIDLLWFDGDWAKMDMTDIVGMARKNQPGVIIVDRHGKPEYVNYLTPEQKVPDHFIPHPWETCMTMGRSWSYVEKEEYKPARKLIQILVDVVAKNGNLLLDIGPGPDGEWHQEAYDRLNEIGAWIKVNGEAIYGAKPVAPYRQDKWGYTAKGKALYASYLPDEKEMKLASNVRFYAPAISNSAVVTLLGSNKSLKWKKAGDKIEVNIPEPIAQQAAGQPVWVFKIVSTGPITKTI
ncbi:alpha-L-fucosidase [Mucilaginibacter gracilis]|uniref:alpha-L-fucosidase n=2 Tax=Mucilaginibacter gracilis TaxID=423350 RepID=A0A495IT21_9SPHI|nr:alpha-L-fucosidase [Mucilaginibacter gracilis]